MYPKLLPAFWDPDANGGAGREIVGDVPYEEPPAMGRKLFGSVSNCDMCGDTKSIKSRTQAPPNAKDWCFDCDRRREACKCSTQEGAIAAAAATADRIFKETEARVAEKLARPANEVGLPACECGKERHGFIGHSDWCPSFETLAAMRARLTAIEDLRAYQHREPCLTYSDKIGQKK